MRQPGCMRTFCNEMYRIQYGATDYRANCYDNLCSAFRELGVEPEPLTTSLNFLMNVAR